jgi:ABC-2 type transport system ATP-binding protein
MYEPLSIVATGLTKHFGEVTAVNDLSLNIRPGEIYGFLGLNGAGKTTTIRMLLGMIRPSAGSVSLFGTMVRPGERAIWRRVGYLVETPHAYPDLTVRENLEIASRLRRLDDGAAVENIMEALRLTPYAERRAGKLSLGSGWAWPRRSSIIRIYSSSTSRLTPWTRPASSRYGTYYAA